MSILWWALFGLVAGFLARFLMPGRDPAGVIVILILGLGAVVGGFIGTQLGWGDIQGFDMRSMGLAVGGAMLLLFGYRMMQKGKQRECNESHRRIEETLKICICAVH